MRVPVAIIAGALMIAASILIVGRYSIGQVGTGAQGFSVYGIDTWTGEPFERSQAYDE